MGIFLQFLTTLWIVWSISKHAKDEVLMLSIYAVSLRVLY